MIWRASFRSCAGPTLHVWLRGSAVYGSSARRTKPWKAVKNSSAPLFFVVGRVVPIRLPPPRYFRTPRGDTFGALYHENARPVKTSVSVRIPLTQPPLTHPRPPSVLHPPICQPFA
ncbi:unnamed protein product, partial [Scytosiphon promiscuus]